MPKFLTRYDRRPIRFSSSQPSMTVQADLADTLIPNIFAQHGIDALSSHQRVPMFGDFTQSPDGLQDAFNRLLEAQANFLELPATVRERFGNDPMKLVAFLSDTANRSEAVSLGLIDDVSPAAPAAPADKAGGTPSRLDVTVPGDTTQE